MKLTNELRDDDRSRNVAPTVLYTRTRPSFPTFVTSAKRVWPYAATIRVQVDELPRTGGTQPVLSDYRGAARAEQIGMLAPAAEVAERVLRISVEA